MANLLQNIICNTFGKTRLYDENGADDMTADRSGKFCRQPRNAVVIGEGSPLDCGEAPPRPIVIPDADREGHIFTMGATRSGKTRLAEAMIEYDIKAGRNILWIDPKGDNAIFSKIVSAAKSTGREDDLMYFSPVFPGYSVKIDPLSHYFMTEEIVNHVISGIRVREEFYLNIAYEITLVVVQSLILISRSLGERPVFTFRRIKENIGYEELQSLRSQVAEIDGEEAKEVLGNLDQILASPHDYFSKVSSSLRTVITSLSSGSVGEIIGKDPANKFIDRLESGCGVILVVQTGSLLTRKTAHIMARVLLSMVQSLVGRIIGSQRKIDPPLAVYADEASNILYFGIDDLFNKAGSAGVWLHMLTQSKQDLVAELGPAYAGKILDNTNTKIVFRVNDPNTAGYVSRMAGTKAVFSPIMSLSGGLSVREMREDRIGAETVMSLARREFFAFTFSGIYKGRTLDVGGCEEIRFPQVLNR